MPSKRASGHASAAAPRPPRRAPSTGALQPTTLPQKSVTYILYDKMQPAFLLQLFSLSIAV